MPWTEELPNGKFRACWRDLDGRKHRKNGFTQNAAALRCAGQQETTTRSGGRAYEGRGITWGAWCPQWLALRVVEPSTARNDALWIDKYLMPQWGKQRLTGISRSSIQAWVNELQRGTLAPSSIRRIFYVFSASMKAAVRDGRIQGNPCQTVDLPASGAGVERYLTRPEFDAVLHHLRDPYKTAAVLLVGTGMRFGELAGLHWSRVDLENGLITIAETWDPSDRSIKAYPKSKKPRVVPLVDWVIGALAGLEHGGGKCGQVHAKGSHCSSPLVLTTAEGTPLNARNMLQREWTPAVQLAGLPHARLHDIRHTFASWLRQAGVDLEQVQDLLGHAAITTTSRYSHLGDTQHAKVLAALDQNHVSSVLPH